MFNLSGKTALVTGASGGIGGAIAKALKEHGAKVAISGTNQGKLEALNKELDDKAIIITANLADRLEVEKLAIEAEAQLEQVDILVNNAGITKDGLLMRMKNEDFTDVLDVNLTSTFILTRGIVRGMMKRKYGRIINISSVVGTMGNPGQANYCASKGGLVAMTKSIAQELSSRNITANCIAPGFIDTAMTDKLNEDQKGRIVQNIPVGRLGVGADIAAAAVYLASEEAAYVTGQTIHVNGGLLMV